jgi:hypothetical protein
MVGAPGFSNTASQGAHHRRFLALMVGALGFSVSATQGPVIDVSKRWWWALPDSPTLPPRGPLFARYFSVNKILGPCAAKDLER